MPTLFISHSSQDEELVRRLSAWLVGHGYGSLFLDFDPERGIPAGARWEATLYSQLRRADALLFVSTAAAAASKWCFAELTMARSLGKPIIPVSVNGGGRHPLLADVQGVELGTADGFERLDDALRRAELDPERSFDWDPTRSPFPGLVSFAEPDAGVFFGRAPEIEGLLEVLNSTRRSHNGRFIGVVGPSGSGKSSLVAAGLIPRLRRLPSPWLVLSVGQPGERPLRQLALALARALPDSADALEASLTRSPDALRALAEPLTDDGRRNVLLTVDQGEELFTTASRRESDQFLELLRRATRGSGRLWSLLVLRSEFLSALLQRDGGAEAIDAKILVGPLARTRLAEVIARPAARAALDLEPGLVESIVEDTGGGDALPLLAFTLSELFESAHRRSTSRITHEDYKLLGGVIGALSRRADRADADLREQGLGDRIMPTLVRLVSLGAEGEPTRRRLERSRLDAAEQRVVDAFVEARLLATGERDGTPIVEVSHEALLRQWPPLAGEIARERHSIRLRTEVERAAQEWRDNGRQRDYLLSGQRLYAAEQLSQEHGDVETEFVKASVARREAQQRVRRRITVGALGGLTAALLAVSSLGLVAHSQAVKATRARDRAQATQFATDAFATLADDPGNSLALAMRGYEKEKTPFTEAALRSAAGQATPQTILRTGESRLSDQAVSGDGNQVAIMGSDRTIRVIDTRRPQAAPRLIKPRDRYIFSIALDRSGGELATSDGIDNVRVYDTHAPSRSPAGLVGGAEFADEVALSADGRRLVEADSYNDQLVVIDLRRPRDQIRINVPIPSQEALAFAPDGWHVAVAGGQSPVQVVDARDPAAEPLSLPTFGGKVTHLGFAPHGDLLATVSLDGTVRVYDLRARRPPSTLTTGGAAVQAGFSSDGGHLVTAGRDGTVRIFALPAHGRAPTVISTGQRFVYNATFAEGDRVVNAIGVDGTVRSLQWRRAPETATTFAATPRTDWQVAALADGGTYLARAPEVRGDVRLIDWRTAAKPPIVFPGHESLSDIAVTPDGRHVATFDFDSVVRVYDRTVPDAPVSSFKVARSTFGQLAFLSDGRRLAVSGDGGSVRFYDWRHPKARTVSVGATKASDLVTAMAIAPGAQEVALAVSDSVVRLFHARPLGYSKTLIATQQGDLNALAFSRDARRLATGGDDGTVQVLNRRAPERPSIVLSAGRQAIDGVAFAPDGYHLASAGEDGSVKVFDWRTPNTPPLVLRSGGKPVDVVQFARDGHHVVSVSRDGVVQVADCQACGPLGDVMALARERLPRRPGAA